MRVSSSRPPSHVSMYKGFETKLVGCAFECDANSFFFAIQTLSVNMWAKYTSWGIFCFSYIYAWDSYPDFTTCNIICCKFGDCYMYSDTPKIHMRQEFALQSNI